MEVVALFSSTLVTATGVGVVSVANAHIGMTIARARNNASVFFPNNFKVITSFIFPSGIKVI
jgi:hypothetical protein